MEGTKQTFGGSKMSMGDHCLRAFRPSRFVTREEVDDDSFVARQENLAKYELRAREGLPLFDSMAETHLPSQRKKK